LAQTVYFEKSLFKFLKELKANNNREWFQENRERYQSEVREPIIRFVADFSPRLKKISPYYLADPRPVGGSVLRQNRDTRFAADKSPYKLMAGALFRHEKGKTVQAPGFLLHLQPGESFAGIGIYSPDSSTLARIRQKIGADPEGWKKAISGKAFRERCQFTAGFLQRPPRGYAPDHPCIEDLKRKHFCTTTDFTEAEICSADFMNQYTDSCKAAADFMQYLTTTLGLEW
jgi:uncharacterized protein (TIGR02453 family)